MILKILKWLLVILAIKGMAAWFVEQAYVDLRREISAREVHCRSYEPTVVFIGTSRTLFGVNPSLFDSLNQGRTKSYNFGVFSISPRGSIQLADRLLSEVSSVETIYVELSALEFRTLSLSPQEVVPEAIFRTRLMRDCSTLSLQEKAGSFLKGLNTVLFQMVSIAPQIFTIKKMIFPKIDPIEGTFEIAPNGHQTVDYALRQVTANALANKEVTQRLLSLQREGASNEFFLAEVARLVERARAKGKEVIFYYPNNVTVEEYPVLSEVAPYLPENILLTLSDEVLLDTLFAPEHLFDSHHLNQKGAAIYTEFLQRKRIEHQGSL